MRFLLVIVLLYAFVTNGATYYLSFDGNDSSAGTATNTAWKTLRKAAQTVAAGDTVYIRGGTYDMAGSYGYTYFGLGQYDGVGVAGTPSSPIILSNYPGEVPLFINCNPSGSGVAPIAISQTAWVKIFGLSVSNSRVTSIDFGAVTNCELAYCTLMNSYTGTFTTHLFIRDNAKSNYIHHNTVYHNNRTDSMETADLVDIGQTWAYPLTNGCSWNVIASNTFYHGQHAVLVDQGWRNYYKGNTYHNEEWMDWSATYGQLGGHRNVGVWGYGAWFDGERVGYAGQPLANDGASGFEVMGGSNVFRRCEVFWNENWGIQFYDKDNNHDPNYNYVYHCTLAHNGLGQAYVTNLVTLTTNDIRGSKSMLRFGGATNNVIKNNLFAYNGGNVIFGGASNFIWQAAGSTPIWSNNFTNSVGGDPLFTVDTSTADNPWATTNRANPDFRLLVGSPCIDAGGWLTTCSGSGSGTSLTVADANYFFPGIAASGTVFPGDTIQLQGQTTTATITAISGNTLTLDTSLTWTNGQGVALAYSGDGPDIGANEYSGSTPVVPSSTSANVGNLIIRNVSN